ASNGGLPSGEGLAGGALHDLEHLRGELDARGRHHALPVAGCSGGGSQVKGFRAKHALGLDPWVETGSHSNQVYADCVDLSAVENASKTRIQRFGSDSIRTDQTLAGFLRPLQLGG